MLELRIFRQYLAPGGFLLPVPGWRHRHAGLPQHLLSETCQIHALITSPVLHGPVEREQCEEPGGGGHRHHRHRRHLQTAMTQHPCRPGAPFLVSMSPFCGAIAKAAGGEVISRRTNGNGPPWRSGRRYARNSSGRREKSLASGMRATKGGGRGHPSERQARSSFRKGNAPQYE